MAIIATSAPVNRIFRSVAPKSLFESALSMVSSACTWNQGDLLAVIGGLIKPVAATADAENLLGVARQSVTSGKVVGPYDGLTAVNAAQAIGDLAGPEYGSVATLKLLSGDVFTPGAAVYLADGANCATVSMTDPGDGFYVGIYQGASVTATATSQGPVLVGARYLQAGLSF